MATIAQLRDGLAGRLATITGLRASAVVPEQINPPVAVVSLDRIEYDSTLARGADRFIFTVTVLVSRPAERSGQAAIDAYAASSGATSVKEAIEAEATLGGVAMDCHVTQMRGVSPVSIGDQTYLSAEFEITVLAA